MRKSRKRMRNATRACIATSTCRVLGWDSSLPGSVTLHLVLDHAHLSRSDLLGHELPRLLDCSDIAGDPAVWSLRPFDPHTHAVSAALDAEVLLLLADAGRLARTRGRQLLRPCSVMVAAAKNAGLEARGVRFVWQGSYRSEAPGLELSAVLRVLSPRAATVLPSAPSGPRRGDAPSSSTTMERLLHAHGVAGKRILALPSPRGPSRRHPKHGMGSSAERGREMLRFAGALLTVPAVDGATPSGSRPLALSKSTSQSHSRGRAAGGGGATAAAGTLRHRRERSRGGGRGRHKRDAHADHTAQATRSESHQVS